jgi:NAD(P)H dehydrogenase (quinone)
MRMKVSVILGHPASGSFNHAIADAVVKRLQTSGHEARFHDLYAEGFDPLYTAAELKRDAVLPDFLESHCRELGEAEGLVIIHPNYWSRPPAILCGWVDRVFRQGRAYAFMPDGKGGAKAVGLLKVKTALVFNTANTPQAVEESVYGDPLEVHWRKVVFGLAGITNVFRQNFSSVIVSSPERRAKWLDEVRAAVDKYFPK